MDDENREMSSSKTGRIRKKSAKMLEMEELDGAFGDIGDREDSFASRFELSWNDAGMDDAEYSILRDGDDGEDGLGEDDEVDVEDHSNSSLKNSSKDGQRVGMENKNSKKKFTKQRKYYTAYKVWYAHMKHKEVHKLNHLNPVQFQRRLKDMWYNIGAEEKIKWRKKAHVMSKNGDQLLEEMDATGGKSAPDLHGDERLKTNSTEAIDLAAQLRLLSESLNTIGSRLVEHKGKIAVQGSLSVLLDSLVCMLACLISASRRLPGEVGRGVDDDQNAALLDNIAYIMPGIG